MPLPLTLPSMLLQGETDPVVQFTAAERPWGQGKKQTLAETASAAAASVPAALTPPEGPAVDHTEPWALFLGNSNLLKTYQ